MTAYMRTLGVVLTILGLVGSAACWRGARDDDAYYRALKGLEKYPANVLYQTEFKMAEPRHMLLLAGMYGSASGAVVLGGICLALGSVLARLPRTRI